MGTELQEKTQGLGVMLQKNMKSIESLLPANMDSAKLCRIAINACIKNPALASCKPATFLMAVMQCAETGLIPSMGESALVPFKGVVTFQPMYQGLIKLARNSGEVSTIYTKVVRKGDKFKEVLGLNPDIIHEPLEDNEGELTHVYAVAKLKDGGTQFIVMNKKQVEKRQGVSKAGRSDAPWKTWEEEMWSKTALKKLCGMLPKSTELASAVDASNRADMGKPALPSGIELEALDGVTAEDIADAPEGEGEIAPPQRRSRGKKPDPEKEAPKGEEQGEVSKEELDKQGWGEGDQLPMD